jgi:hypothetical protein
MKFLDGNLCLARITKGALFEHFKDIDLFGMVDANESFRLFGSKDEDQDRFYKCVLNHDKAKRIFGLETIEEVKELLEEAGVTFFAKKGEYEVIDELKGEKIDEKV